MKRLQALLLLSLASTFLLFGCGKKEEVDEQPAVRSEEHTSELQSQR